MRPFLLASPFLALTLLGACLGDGSSGGPRDSGTPDVAPQDAALDTAAPTDVATTCAAGTADCNPDLPGCETVLATSDTDCGACGHDCGGKNLCQAGLCGPMVIAPNVASPVSLAVTDPSVFWMVDNEIDRCPIGGCPTQYPSDVGNGVHPLKSSGYGPSYMATDTTNVYFAGYTSDSSQSSIYFCAVAGCGGNSPVAIAGSDQFVGQMVANTTNVYWMNSNDGNVTRIRKTDHNQLNLAIPYLLALSDLAADDNHLLISDSDAPVNGGGVYVCNDPATDCVNTHFTLLVDTADHVATNGTLALIDQKGSGSIVACDMTQGCSGTPTPLATGEMGVSALAADATAVYWAVKGTGTSGLIRTCSLPSCAGGPRTIATGQASPRALVLDADYVYWANTGSGAPNTGSIVRVRKPLP